MNKKDLTSQFSQLFLTISSNTNTLRQDDFWSNNLSKKLAALIQAFLDFLEHQPQAGKFLFLELNSLQDLFSMMVHLKIIQPLSFATIEKEVLVFKKYILGSQESNPKKSIVNIKEVSGSISYNRPVLNPLKKRILGFINKEGEILNLEVFGQFKEVSKRTLKRHLSDLINMGYIDRESQGKKVFYKKSSRQLN